MSNEYYIGIAAAAGAIFSAVLTFLASILKLRREGITAEEAGRLSDRAHFQNEMRLIAEEARASAAMAHEEIKDVMERNRKLIDRNNQLEELVMQLRDEVSVLRIRLNKYEKMK